MFLKIKLDYGGVKTESASTQLPNKKDPISKTPKPVHTKKKTEEGDPIHLQTENNSESKKDKMSHTVKKVRILEN